MAGPVIITGGGTGGHVFPMQAIAEQLQTRGIDPNKLRFVGSVRGQESTLLVDRGIALTLLPGRGLRRSFAPQAMADNAGAVWGLARAGLRALVLVGRTRPAAVVSVGGYASVAIVVAAVLWRRPLVLVELDAAPSAAHRLFGRFAVRRCTAFASSEPNALVTGAPLRDAILRVDRSIEARRTGRLAQHPPVEARRDVVVVMTGSLGAHSVNQAVTQLAQLWSTRADRTLWHVTGRRDFDEVVANRPLSAGLDYRIVPFANMADLWAIADAAICRAGATTIAELTALGIPAVLVPLPGAPRDHQTKNAQAVVDVGGALMVRDRDCRGVTLGAVLDDVLSANSRAAMSRASATMGRRDAASRIAEVVAEVGGLS